MNRTRISYSLLVLMFLVFVTGQYVHFHDIYTIPFVLAALGAVVLNRRWKGWVVAAAFLGLGLYWSRAEQNGCSFWWRARYIVDKSMGRLPYVSWDDVGSASFGTGHCFYPENEDHPLFESIKLLAEEHVDGHPFQQYKTSLGNFWIPEENGQGSLAWLVWEISVDQTYQGHEDTIRPGDTVIDSGAHVGVYTRYALKRGAARVIAIEPNPDNIACLERNFAQEIAAGKVILEKAGIWDKESQLELHLHEHISTRPTLFYMEGMSRSIKVPVRPLDHIVEELGLDRVDFIKMDIEGAEREALAGARHTIERFHPRMAICTYHLEDDPVVIPQVTLGIQPDYRVHAKELAVNHKDSRPKVLFFN